MFVILEHPEVVRALMLHPLALVVSGLQDLAKKERKRRMEQRKAERFGLTKDKKGFVAAALVDQLTAGGFSRGKAVR